MIQSFKTWIYERLRCGRHNLLHLRTFRLGYRRGHWHVSDGDVEMTFSRYPYLAFHDIEGYLFDGRWKPQPGETIVDAGGCFGEFSIYAAKRVGPTGRVLMLEPDPANRRVAQEFLALNGSPPNVEIVPAGLWREPGVLKFEAGQGATSAVAGADASGEHVIEIPVHSLASLADAYQLARIDLVKMDIEGAEVEVIAGASQHPQHLRPRYAIASYHIVDGERTSVALEKKFAEMNYEVRSGFPKHLTTWASPRSPIA